MTRFAGALLATAVCVGFAQADEAHPCPSGYQGTAGYPAIIEGPLWTNAVAPPLPDDAYVFADVAHGSSLSPDVVVAAARFDIERMARPGGSALGSVSTPIQSGRVAHAFSRFAPVGQDGLTYASIEVATGRNGPASLTSQADIQQSVLAMTSQSR